MRMVAWAAAAAVALHVTAWVGTPAFGQDLSKLKPKDIPKLMAEADKFIAADDLPQAAAYLKAIVGLDPKQAPMYAQMLVGMVALTGQWWLENPKAKKRDVAAALVNLAWNGLTGLESKPTISHA